LLFSVKKVTFEYFKNKAQNKMKFSSVSIAAYARELEVSPRLIRKAIDEKKIVKAIHYKGERICGINKYQASWEWLENSPGANSFNKKHLVERLEGLAEHGKPEQAELKSKKSNIETSDLESLTSSELRKKQEILKIEKLELELREKKGFLVEASKVSESMYNFGSQIKASIMAVPDRIIDDLMASENRAEAYLKLQKALSDSLRDLADKNLN
jgi:hypothetical protein